MKDELGLTAETPRGFTDSTLGDSCRVRSAWLVLSIYDERNLRC